MQAETFDLVEATSLRRLTALAVKEPPGESGELVEGVLPVTLLSVTNVFSLGKLFSREDGHEKNPKP